MLFDLCARRCARVAGLVRPSGLFCRVLALPAVFLIDTSLCRYPLLNSIPSLVWSYRARSAASIWRPRGAHFPCLGKSEATPTPILMRSR